MRTEIETMTPGEAQSLLGNNEKNRNMRWVQVDRYAEDMTSNRWQVNGQPIIIGEDGSLIDGQHRLAACVKAQVAFRTLVVRDAPVSIRSTVDTGRSRTASDVLAIHGHKNTRNLGSIASIIFNYATTGSLERSFADQIRSPTPRQIQEVVEHFEGLTDLPALASKLNAFPFCTTIAAFSYLMKIGCSPEGYKHFERFMETIQTGAGLPSDSPILQYRNQALAERSRPGRRRGRSVWVAMLIKAWNLSAKNETCELLFYRVTESFPTPMLFDEERFMEYATRPSKEKTISVVVHAPTTSKKKLQKS